VPAAQPVLTEDQARQIVGDCGFGNSPAAPDGAGRVGVELEWLVVRTDDHDRPAEFDTVRDAVDALGPLPGGSLVTFEPGGQVELSSPALPGLDACEPLGRDCAVLEQRLRDAGAGLVALGLAPGPAPDRVVRSPRYDAMEAFFDGDGAAGRTMMRGTAAIQVNVDLGGAGEAERRWRLAHDLGPVLAAAFANSPLAHGVPTGWRSTRLAVWFDVDPGRSAPVVTAAPGRRSWADYALAARVMLVRCSEEEHRPLKEDLAFSAWIADGHELGWPTPEDLEYHLTTLFPPVRPRRWLELRMIDALPDPWWRVAVAVSSTLLADGDLAGRVAEAAAPTRHRWRDAARHGLADAELRRAACDCFAAALEAMPERGADPATVDATAAYVDRYVARGRCPADDRLDAWARDGVVVPEPEGGDGAWT
jgi:glutamate--cysteine ligase